MRFAYSPGKTLARFGVIITGISILIRVNYNIATSLKVISYGFMGSIILKLDFISLLRSQLDYVINFNVNLLLTGGYASRGL